MCVLLWFFSIHLLKTLNPEITLLNQFHAQKALFEVPKICSINLGWGAAFSNNMQLKNKRSGNLSFMKAVKSPIKIVTWIYQNWYMDFCKLLHGFVKVVPGIPRPCQTKPSWSLTKNSELIEASAQTYSCLLSQSTQCLGSVVPLAMFQKWFLEHLETWLEREAQMLEMLSRVKMLSWRIAGGEGTGGRVSPCGKTAAPLNV